MGDLEAFTPVGVESSLGYHPSYIEVLTGGHEAGHGTLSGGQFDWGGRLLKGNGGAQRYPQNGWKPFEERKGRRMPDCETDKSSREETRT